MGIPSGHSDHVMSHEFLHCPLSLPQPSPGGQRRIKAGTEGVTWHTLRHEAPWQTTRHHHVAPAFPAAQASRRILSSRCAGSLHSGAVAAKAGIGDPVPVRLHDFDEPGFELRGLREAKNSPPNRLFCGETRLSGSGSFRSVPELVARINQFVQHYNLNCRPFAWTAAAFHPGETLPDFVHVFPGHNASQAVGPLASWRLTLIADPGNGAKEASLQTQATFSNRFLRPAAGDGVGAHR